MFHREQLHGWKNTGLKTLGRHSIQLWPWLVRCSQLQILAHNCCHFCSSECVISPWNVKSFITFTETQFKIINMSLFSVPVVRQIWFEVIFPSRTFLHQSTQKMPFTVSLEILILNIVMYCTFFLVCNHCCVECIKSNKLCAKSFFCIKELSPVYIILCLYFLVVSTLLNVNSHVTFDIFTLCKIKQYAQVSNSVCLNSCFLQ